MASPKWHPMTVRGGQLNSTVHDLAKDASGAYAIRRASTHEVVYVGESSRGVLWKTLLRHFHAPKSFKWFREGFVVASPVGWEVALHVTSRGRRPRASSARGKKSGGRPAEQKASEAQARWIESLRPTLNKDDGRVSDETLAREVREAQEANESERPWYENPARRKGSKEYEEGYRDGGREARTLSMRAVEQYLSLTTPRAGDEYDAGHRAAFVQKAMREADASAVQEREPAKNPSKLVQGGRVVKTFASKRAAIAAGKALVRRTGKPAKVETPRASGPSRERTHVANPGALLQLGLMTRLELCDGTVLAWTLRDAPVLAYDASRTQPGGACLVIGYRRGRVVRSSSPEELREYKRKHWGAIGRGEVSDCGESVGPFVSLGPSRSITYTTKKGNDSALIDYVHPWGEGSFRRCIFPRVQQHRCKGGCATGCAARGSIRLVGGTYSLEDRGIVG